MRYKAIWPVALGLVMAAALNGSAEAAAYIEVIGTGNASADVANVQAAVDFVESGGEVRLIGSFNFDGPPTAGYPRMVTITRSLTISGPAEMATIHCGTTPGQGTDAFVIAAPGADVTIRGLRIVSPENAAIVVVGFVPPQFPGGLATPGGVGNLSITDSVIEGVRPFGPPGFLVGVSSGILINPPLPAFTGAPPPFLQIGENFTGDVTIVNNLIDIGGTSNDATYGIFVGPLGSWDAHRELDISENVISNTTSRAILVGPKIRGEARIERNDIETGDIRSDNLAALQAIAVSGVDTRAGSYTVAHNRVSCGSDNGQCIFLLGTDGALVRSNRIEVSSSGPMSAALLVAGSRNTDVVANRLAGAARTGFSIVSATSPAGLMAPLNNALIGNNHQKFAATLADIEVGAGAQGTTVVGGAGAISIASTATDTTVHGNYTIVP